LNTADSIRQARGVDKFDEIIFICIGSNQVMGDSLGPLVGSSLVKRGLGAFVYGTMEDPFHALNMFEILDRISLNRPRILTVAVDACLGYVENVGKIQVYNRGLKPGLGVGKDLPPIGDMSIAGIINFHGISADNNELIAQNTNEQLVRSMSRVISKGIVYMLRCLNK
jgi:putative sporulation protein YyaC